MKRLHHDETNPIPNSNNPKHPYLILVAWALAVLSKGSEALINQFHVVGVDVEAEQNQSSGGDSTDAVQELESLEDEVVAPFAVFLLPEVVLPGEKW